jgi:hypothetical protein
MWIFEWSTMDSKVGFFLPTVAEMLQTVLPGYWYADNDYGEIFLNFPLPGDVDYDPTLPLIAEVPSDGKVAANVYIDVDDRQITARTTQELAWMAASCMHGQGLFVAGIARCSPKKV